MYRVYTAVFRNISKYILKGKDMSENLEIERKFLVAMPDIEKLDVRRSLSITQTYLTNGVNHSQRRVRCIEQEDGVKFTYTEKIFITPSVRRENEYEIDRREYEKLLTQKNNDLKPVRKRRVCFLYRGQLFELDCYPFSEKFAILELELENEQQEIFFPETIRIIDEVTGVEEYSNANLAKAGAFPREVK